MAKYLKNNPAGGFVEEATIVGAATSAANAGLVPELNASGQLNPALLNAAANGANKIPILDTNGRLDVTTMPTGFGTDTNILTASEALSAGDFVNVWSGGVRKADASTGKTADGFVLSAVANGGAATVYFEGTNTAISGVTIGKVFLSGTTPAAASTTPATGTGKIAQSIGYAVSTTAINFQAGPAVLLV